jgi:hypothetical protein
MSINIEEEFKNWDYLFSGIEDQDGIEDDEKGEIFNNWKQLRDDLGEDWPKNEKNNDHALRMYLFNRAPWSIRWVSELGFGISSLKNKKDFDDIFKRLLSVRAFRGAYYELRVALSLLKLGVSFEFLRPTNNKTPDIKTISDTRPMFIEITKKNEPENYTLASKNYNTIVNFLFSKTSEKNLDFCCDIQRLLSTPRSEKIKEESEKLVELAKVSGIEHYHDDEIDIYIFKKGKRNQVPKEQQVIQGQMPNFDEIFRIKTTLKKKVTQLENYSPGVLLIFDDLIWPSEDIELFYKNLVDELVVTVEEYPKLSALVVYIETYNAFDDDAFMRTGKNYISIKGYDKNLLRSRNKVIILNEFADCPLLQNEIEILKTI